MKEFAEKLLAWLGKIGKGYGTIAGLVVAAVGVFFADAVEPLNNFLTGFLPFVESGANLLAQLGAVLAAFGVGRKAQDNAAARGVGKSKARR